MDLFYREFGVYSEHKPSLVFLHGLFGSSSNWQTIARRLESDYHILALDLRNHGRSPHHDTVGYAAMAGDLAHYLDQQGLEQVVLVGHSMGGKVAMWMALNHPQLVERLVVVDIAPVSYGHSFDTILNALNAIDLSVIQGRADADQVLASYLPELGLRQFLLQNLSRTDSGWQWRVNLAALQSGIEELLAFPEPPAGVTYTGKTLFLHGAASNYVSDGHLPRIHALFPSASLYAVAGAGHWVYAEQPEAFLQGLKQFLP